MKTTCCLFLFFICFIQLNAQNRAAHFTAFSKYYQCGDIDVTGNQLTVEALVKLDGSGPYITGQSANDIVSKHNGANDANYILRPDHCEITTVNGHFYTSITSFPSFSKDSFYHVALVYDGSSLKFYVNGCVFSQVTASGNLITNSYQTTIGQLASNPTALSLEQLYGFTDEVRIWNVARTQTQIKDNMLDLPNPTTQTGLLAYYKFEGNSNNVQGNTAYNGIPFGSPFIEIQDGFNAVKPLAANYSIQQPTCNGSNGSVTIAPSGGKSPYQYSLNGGSYQNSNVFSNLAPGTHTISIKTDGVGCNKDTSIILTAQCGTSVVGFTAPDTVCVNTPVNITNTSTGASSYFWNFCVANVNTPPTGVNLGNLGGFSAPVYIDYVLENGNYYGFMTNNWPGGLLRLNFGNSLLNTPTVTNLGTVGGVITNQTEGVQVVKNEGKWYVLIVQGEVTAVPPTVPSIVKVELGTNIANNTPTATSWGNIGSMSYPHDLYVFDDNGHWYGFTVNFNNNTITRFDFTTSFSNTPTAVNLGNIGGLSGPAGVLAMKENGNWYAFVTSALNHSIARLNFGSSLLNTPTATNLGNVGGIFNKPWDIHIMKYCGQNIGFVINAENSLLLKLDFGNSITNVPTAISYGNIGSLNFPHCLSKVFRVGADLYSFIPNVNNSTLTRIKFTGCTSASIPSSTAQNPPPVTYNTPGIYNINLTTDDGLPTQSAFCKQVVVMAPPNHTPTQNISQCFGRTVKIGSPVSSATYLWSTGASTDSITVSSSGTYWVQSNRYGCSVRDSFVINFNSGIIDFGSQQNLCNPKTVQFSGNFSNLSSFEWNFGDGQTNSSSLSPSNTYLNFGNYNVKLKVVRSNGCIDTVLKNIVVESVLENTLISNADTTICLGDSLLIRNSNNILNYCWQTSNGPVPISLNSYVKPVATTTYSLNSQVIGNNLIVNGDFSSGNTGFTSQYTYNSSSGFNAGVYNVGNSITAWHPGMSPCQDHTSGNGRMLMVNGTDVANVKVWTQTINVQPNTNYVFYTWLQHITTVNPAQLQFSINGSPLGNIFTANSQSCIWERFNAVWNSGNNSTATISIVNMNQQFSGNDFALDDIFFGPVNARTDSFTVNVTGLCDSIDIAGPNKICSTSDTLTYSIYKAANCTQQYTLLVDPAFANIVSQNNNSIRLVFTQNGSTTIRVAYSNNCKTVVDSLPVTIRFSPTSINFGPDITQCRDTSFTLNAGNGFLSYLWQDGSSNASFFVNTSGVYHVVAQTLCGVQFTDTMKLLKSVPSIFAASPANVAACEGDSANFTASGGSVYDWSPASKFLFPNNASSKAILDQTQNYQVHISDPVCLRDTIIIIPVTASAGPQITLTKSNDVTCSNDSAVLKASGAVTYTWSPNLFISSSSNGRITVRPPYDLTYTVLSKDALGCTSLDSIQVKFIKEGEQKLYMPNAFTPNGDGLNDLFKPAFTGPATSFDFRIFNRWGQLVFQSSTPGVGWDGRFRSELQPGDVYVYYIVAEGGCNGKFWQKGTFVLIR